MLIGRVRQGHARGENREMENSSDGRALLFARHSGVLVTGTSRYRGVCLAGMAEEWTNEVARLVGALYRVTEVGEELIQAKGPAQPNGDRSMVDLQNSCWNRRVCGVAAARAAVQQMLNWV